MKYFAAIQSVLDAGQIAAAREPHLEYLRRMSSDGKIHLFGRFPDGTGSLTIYKADTIEDARQLAEGDPYVAGGARRLDLHEWDMKPRPE